MANLKFLILAASVAFFISPSHAGYANLQPPPGFNTSSSGATTYTKSANNVPFNTNTVRTNASLNVGGRVITIPAYARIAANAATILAPLLFRNPWVYGAVALGGAAAVWYWDSQSQSWQAPGDVAFPPGGLAPNQQNCESLAGWTGAPGAFTACSDLLINNPQFLTRDHTISGNPGCSFNGSAGWYYYVGGFTCSTLPIGVPRTITEDEFNTEVLPQVSPALIPSIIPNGFPIPVTQPVINPSVDPDPVPQPFRVPVGDPVPVPNTNPQQWRNPVIDIVPTPTPLEPWRVDLQPRDIIKLEPSLINSPLIQTNNPNETPQEKTPGLCEQFPDILACQKPNLDTPSTDKIQTKDVAISITPDSGWGADNATCPPARHLSGANIDFEFTTICNFMSGFRPVMIAVSWLIAAMILIGFKRGE